jgi:ABC-type ATPase involved in cell division
MVALGPVPGVTDLDGGLTAEEHLTERLLLRRRGPRSRRAQRRLTAALDGAGLTAAELPLRADALTALQGFRVGLAAALLGAPRVVVVDDLGDRLSSDDTAAAWRTLRALADAGLTVVAATREAPPEADLVVATRPSTAAEDTTESDQPEPEKTHA